MKKVLSIIFVLTFLLGLIGCSSKDKIPSLNEASQMKYSDINQALSGKDIQKIRNAWGEPAESDGKVNENGADDPHCYVLQFNVCKVLE